jgi:3-dehydroquinate synthase
MKSILHDGHQIYFDTELAPLRQILTERNYSKVFVFVDTNTSEVCLPLFRSLLDDLEDFDIIETDCGEENKNIDFCIGIWKTLLDF